MTHKILDVRDKVGNRPRSERKRYLNIIYFIDSNRTRTLKFSIRTSYLTVGTLGLLVTWSLIASLLLMREHGLNTDLRSRSRNLLSVIFNYQTRYDEVYEKAYPDDGGMLTKVPTGSDAGVASTAANEEDEEDTEDKVDLPSLPNSARSAPVALAAKTAPAAAPAPTIADKTVPEPKVKVVEAALEKTIEPPIAVENFSSAVHDETLTVRFSLKNTNKGNKATGTVTAQARFFETGKEGTWLETETQAVESQVDTSDQDDPSSDRHFNIRYYKNKVFHFASPTRQNGLFTAVKVTVKDDQGHAKEFVFPLTKEPHVQQSRLESDGSDAEDSTSPQ